MFHPDQLRDAHGRWSLEGLAKHGVTTQQSALGRYIKTVLYHGNVVGHVTHRNGKFQALTINRNPIPNQPKEHGSLSAAAAHVVAHHMTKGPIARDWHQPPAPTGVAGRKAGGYTAIGVTNTKLGDAVEKALVDHMGFENAHPGKRQGPFDLRYDGHAYEVKAVSSSATEYKAKPKAHEVANKLAHAEEHGLKPHTMIVVYHPGEGRIHVYSKEGIGAYRLTGPQQGWKYHGSAPLDLGSSWDPTKKDSSRERLSREQENAVEHLSNANGGARMHIRSGYSTKHIEVTMPNGKSWIVSAEGHIKDQPRGDYSINWRQ